MRAMDGFGKQAFTAPISGRPTTFDVYTIGAGAPVILMQEMPGIGPEAIAFCKRLADAGFEVCAALVWAAGANVWPESRSAALHAPRVPGVRQKSIERDCRLDAGAVPPCCCDAWRRARGGDWHVPLRQFHYDAHR